MLCNHLDSIREVEARTSGCQECMELGDEWVHLRKCLTCGHIGCCNDSKNQHAQKHFFQTSHPLMQSFEPGESWMWCYVDDVMIRAA